MKTDELREKYLAFFESKGCVRQPSDVLVPTWDPSVLFTPAGMNQFKDHFLGKVKLDFTKATTCQKCLRTGDIDNVGRTAYHHTFFEMLGNFSFGDYFKREAIHWAWEFLTSKKWLAIDPAKLSVTVYKDDDEARRIWRDEIGLSNHLISGMEEDENFWPASAPSLGPDGVCGPCSEIYYQLPEGKNVEIWNLVFTQFNRIGDPPNNLHPLPSNNIDTGMGLERTASVLQGVPTNFHIDILMPIVQAAAEVVGVKYDLKTDDGRRLRRITDHIRACTFAIHENVYPGANGAKYIVRRLIRRAVLDGHQMSMREPFLYKLVGAVANAMKSPYPELGETISRVQDVVKSEEERFLATIDVGLDRISKLFGDMRSQNEGVVNGGRAAELYTSYGVPPELLQQMASEEGFTFDWDGYKQAMLAHSEISGGEQNRLFQTGPLETLKETLRETPFIGYETTSADCVVRGIVSGATAGADDDGALLTELKAGTGQPARLVLNHSPFYGESGGQVGDVGIIRGDGFEFKVDDTQKHAGLIVHQGVMVSGTVKLDQACQAIVDTARRQALSRAHSATHILHYALQKNVGSHAQQQGSKVDADWLRFDFSHQKSLSDETLAQIQQDIVARVQADEPIEWRTVSLAEARKAGAMMLFGEKYPDPVRMVSMGSFSRELCGGTHLTQTGLVEAFELLAEESVSAGTRRVVAITGEKAKEFRQQTVEMVKRSAEILGTPISRLAEKVNSLVQDIRNIKKEIAAGKAGEHAASIVGTAAVGDVAFDAAKAALREVARTLNVATHEIADRIQAMLDERTKLLGELAQLGSGASLTAEDLLAAAETVGEAKLVVAATDNANPNVMRTLIDQLRKTSDKPIAVLLGGAQGDKVLLVGGLSNALVDKGFSAGAWVGDTAKLVGGGGGGRPDMAQAGGKEPEKLPAALEQAKAQMRQRLLG